MISMPPLKHFTPVVFCKLLRLRSFLDVQVNFFDNFSRKRSLPVQRNTLNKAYIEKFKKFIFLLDTEVKVLDWLAQRHFLLIRKESCCQNLEFIEKFRKTTDIFWTLTDKFLANFPKSRCLLDVERIVFGWCHQNIFLSKKMCWGTCSWMNLAK